MKKRTKFLTSQLGIILLVGIAVVVAGGGYAGYKWHETPQFCSTCHLMDPYVKSLTGAGTVDSADTTDASLLASVHGKAGLVCLNCHKPTIKQQVQELIVYSKGDFSTPLEKRKFPDEMCLACHEHDSRQAIAAKTTNYTVKFVVEDRYLKLLQEKGYDYKKDAIINPHLMALDTNNTNDPHAAGGPLIQCSECHSMHDPSPKIDYCFSCHHTHTLAPCTVCHSN
jgi:cytochrome c nitrite reductase small subunit